MKIKFYCFVFCGNAKHLDSTNLFVILKNINLNAAAFMGIYGETFG